MAIQPCIDVNNEWDIVAARQLGRQLAKELGFGDVDQARITTVISELARNIYLYANPGKITITEIHEYGRVGLKIVAEDHGPGIGDIRLAMEDGYTTSNGLGAGLPGVKRLMDEFYIDSATGRGTRIEATKWRN